MSQTHGAERVSTDIIGKPIKVAQEIGLKSLKGVGTVGLHVGMAVGGTIFMLALEAGKLGESGGYKYPNRH
jgi:hypothetical protein